MSVWLSRYVHGLAPREKPTESERGPRNIRAATASQVAIRPAYRLQRARNDSFNDSNRNTRSYSATMIGAVTIDSLHAIPDAHASTDATRHAGAPLAPAARMLQYNVSR